MAFLQVDYKSSKMNRKVHFNVFLPADTDPAGKDGAPWRSLYLLHGIFGNSSSWVTSSCIQRYAEERNLCVVMPDGENGFYLDHPDYMNNYSSWIGEELVEATRTMFPLSRKREDTWIGGFSMGGYGALRTGLKYADTFGGILAFSSALLLESIQNGEGGAGPAGDESYLRAMFGDLKHLLGTDLDPLHLAKARQAVVESNYCDEAILEKGAIIAASLKDMSRQAKRQWKQLFRLERRDKKMIQDFENWRRELKWQKIAS
jgi:S-formylglutathione hydrolase FrmB